MTEPAKRVLVVEDDPDVVTLVALVLEDSGYQVETAANGLEALHSVGRSLPNLILLDMKMPVMNGWEFAEAFYERHDHRAPIVVLTAADDAKRRAGEIGANGWLGKPFSLEALLTTVERHARS